MTGPGGEPLEAELTKAVLSRAVEEQAKENAGRLVFVFENGTEPAQAVTAGDLAVGGNQIAWALHRHGLTPGDRVALVLGNRPEFVYGLVAAAKLGLPAVPVDPRSPPEQLGAVLQAAQCDAVLAADHLITDPGTAAVLRQRGRPAWILSTPEGRAEGLDPWGAGPVLNEFLDGPERDGVGEHVENLAAPWLLAFTAVSDGRTAPLRPVELTHERLVLYRRLPRLFGYRADDVAYTGLPLAGGNALLITVLPALWGAVHHAVLSRTLTISRLWDVCIDHGCTTWSSLGGIAAAVYREPTAVRDRAHRVRLVVSAGMPKEIWRPFEERFGVRVVEWYRAEGSAVETDGMVTGDEAAWLSLDLQPELDGHSAPGLAPTSISCQTTPR